MYLRVGEVAFSRYHSTSVPRPTNPVELARLAPPGTQLAQKIARWPSGLPTEAVQNLRADYADHLALLDTQLGELLNAVDQRKDSSHTAVTVCSDHGELLGDWGLLLKGCFLEGAIRSLFVHRPPQPIGFSDVCAQPGNGLMVSQSCFGVLQHQYAILRTVVLFPAYVSFHVM